MLLAMTLECIQNLPKEVPNPDNKRFYSLLEAVNKPLWEGYMHSQLSLAVRMLSNKLRGELKSKFLLSVDFIND